MNTITIHDNKKCQISLDDSSILKKLKSHFSFKMAGVEYTEAFKRGWNGITYLIDDKGKFNLGLLNKVKVYFDSKNLELEVIDLRKPLTLNEPISLDKSLAKIEMTARDYQEAIVEACVKNQRGIVRAATGSGKSLVTALLTAKLNKPTIIYVIGLDLLKQFHDLYTSLFDEKIGYIGDGVCDVQRITIASVWTIGRSLGVKVISDEEDELSEKYEEHNSIKINRMLKEAKVHIIDECHLSTTDTIRSIYKIIDPEHIYGFSGTPYRDDGSDLLVNSLLGEQIINISASSLIARGVLAQPIIKFIDVPKIQVSNTYQGVYKEFIVENNERNALILKQTKILIDKKYITLILFKQIKHGDILKKLLENNGLECVLLSGKDDLEERTRVKEGISSGKINIVLASTIFDIGVDIKELSALILAGGGKSSIKALQRVGRVIRGFPGKKNAAIVDFNDQVKFLKNHSKIRHRIYSSEEGFKVIKSKGM